MAETPAVCDFGWKAPTFRLTGTDGARHTLEDLRGPNGTLVVFMCNHCPYVKAILDRLTRDARDLAALGVATIGINANDPVAYPEDSFDNMARVAKQKDFPFPYLKYTRLFIVSYLDGIFCFFYQLLIFMGNQ